MSESQRPLRLLSLDGGGIRGLSALYILRSIMIRVNEMAGLDFAAPLRPCDYFDLIAGTSTGGLIAIMLGTLRMDIQTCITEYLNMAPEIFPVESLIKGSTVGKIFKASRGKQRFQAEPLELATKRLIKTYLGEGSIQDEDTLFRFESSKLQNGFGCRAFVCVTSEKLGRPFRFRSYASSWDFVDDCSIWQACRATSAAPTFFPPVQIGNPSVAYVDGGLGYNNPIRALMEEKSHIWPHQEIGCIVSVGTGVPVSKDVGRAIKPLFDKITEIATDTENVARDFEEEIKYKYGVEQRLYYRFNVQKGLDQVGLEEWKEFDRIKVATQDYLKTQWSSLEACSTQIFEPNVHETPIRSAGIKLNQYKATSEELECLQSLWPEGIDYQIQKDQNPKRAADTCLWTLENTKYTSWRDSDSVRLLWISAGPGCGKSVLARCIIDEDLPKTFEKGPQRCILYYFFKDVSPEQRSSARAISAVLHQLFAGHPQLIRRALPNYRELGKALSSTFRKLWEVFTEVVTDPLAGNIVCVFDALDECAEQERHVIIESLKSFCLSQRISSSTSKVKFLVTSRPYFQIRRQFRELFEDLNYIELAGDKESKRIRTEIDRVVEQNVKELAFENDLAESVRDHLERRLLNTENRTYLWLQLVLKILRESLSGSASEMDELIDHLPSGIQDTYETLLERCPNQMFARKVLQIVLAAYRPLTLDEIDFALSVRDDDSSYLEVNLEGAFRLQETLPSRCGLVVSVIESKVYLIHQTVKDFLLGQPGIIRPPRKHWQQSIDISLGHCLMAKACLQSIIISEIRWDRIDLCTALLPRDHRSKDSTPYCKTYAYYRKMFFMVYSELYWADHYSAHECDHHLETVERILEEHKDTLIMSRADGRAALLSAAAGGGHKRICESLLRKGAKVNARSGDYGTALEAAARMGHSEILQLILDEMASIGAQDARNSSTALVKAPGGRHNKIGEARPERGDCIDETGEAFGTALITASRYGQKAIMKILLDKGAEPNFKSESGETPLIAASSRGHEAVVETLLDKGAELDTALIAASRSGRKAVVEMLLDKGANPDAVSGSHGPALMTALENRRKAIMEMLLDRGANPDVKCESGSTALILASRNGYLDAVAMLLDKGADPDIRCPVNGTALEAASAGGYARTVKRLLGKYVNTDNGKRSVVKALEKASRHGSEEIIQILLQHGTNIHIDSWAMDQALLSASGKDEEVSRMLLTGGDSPNGRRKPDLSSLRLSGRERAEEISRMLQNVDVGPWCNEAFTVASEKGCTDIVRMLLERSVEKGIWFRSWENDDALKAAERNGHSEIVQMLKEMWPSNKRHKEEEGGQIDCEGEE